VFCSDGTAQENLLPIILEASNSDMVIMGGNLPIALEALKLEGPVEKVPPSYMTSPPLNMAQLFGLERFD
jgi:hypothetical protein